VGLDRLGAEEQLLRDLAIAEAAGRQRGDAVLAKPVGAAVIEQDSYLLQNQMNPFPVPGQLILDDHGQLSFTLSPKAAGASLGWLEKQIGTDGLKARIEGGEEPVAFSLPIAGVKVAWPKLLGGYAMKLDGGGRTWIVSLNYPSGGGLWQAVNMITSKGTTKPWKQALSAAGAA
jgi:hypothetical protein